MAERTIRAWHYTRMTDPEIEAVRRNGIYLSSLETIRSRFDAQVAAGAFDKETSDRLFADSPYQSEQLGSRSNKFWMVSHPQPVDGSGVELLLESWGGESAYFWQRDPDLQTMLKGIGRPRVLEVAIRSHTPSTAILRLWLWSLLTAGISVAGRTKARLTYIRAGSWAPTTFLLSIAKARRTSLRSRAASPQPTSPLA